MSCFWHYATNCKVQPPPLLVIEEDASYEVECVLSNEDRGSHSRPKKLYLIKWLRWTLEHNYWELESKLNAKVLKDCWGNDGSREPSRTTYLHYMVLNATLKPKLCINIWVKGRKPFCSFRLAQNPSNKALLLICLILQVAWSMNKTTTPLAWFLSWVVVLPIVSIHYGLGFAIYKHGHSFLSGV